MKKVLRLSYPVEFTILFSPLLKNVYKEDILDKMRGTHRLNKAAGMETSV